MPLYLSIRDQLRERIASGIWKPGDILPPEVELARQFGVSPGTIKQAVLALVREALLYRKPGKGTFVAKLSWDGSLSRFFRFTDRHGRDLPARLKLINVKVTSAIEAIIRNKLRVELLEEILVIRRMMLRGDEPICLYTSYIPHRLVPDLENENLESMFLYEILEKKYDIHIVKADEYLEPSLCREPEAQLLGVSAGSPVIIIDRLARTFHDVPVEFRKIVGRGDKFRYHVTLPAVK